LINLGARIWDGSLAIAKYLVDGKFDRTWSCIELGSGCGIPGLVACQYVFVEGHVWLTDRQQYMHLLLGNMDLLSGDARTRVSNQVLEWGISVPETSFDLIIGSELIGVGSRDIFEKLLHTIVSVFRMSKAGGKNPIALIAYRRRACYEEEFFVRIIELGLSWEAVASYASSELGPCVSDYYCNDSPIIILKIQDML